jgi:transposase
MPPYPAEFRQQMVELVRSGRTPAELAREFGCSAQAISNWVAAEDPPAVAARGASAKEPLNANERAELDRLRRDNARLQVERDILAKATAWFAVKSEKTPTPSTNS